MLQRADGGWVVVHCHGKNKGKRVSATPRPVSKAKALLVHRAIQASKSKGRKRAMK